MRNLLATLLLARGTPMLAMGDEPGRTQRGNNNAYAQDNALTWLDWAGADADLAPLHSRAWSRCAARTPRCATTAGSAGAPPATTAFRTSSGAARTGSRCIRADWHDADARALVAVLYVPARDALPADRVARRLQRR